MCIVLKTIKSFDNESSERDNAFIHLNNYSTYFFKYEENNFGNFYYLKKQTENIRQTIKQPFLHNTFIYFCVNICIMDNLITI